MTDTHTHLYLPDFAVEGQTPNSMQGQCAAVGRALAAGVGMMMLPNVDLRTIEPMKALHALRPECTAMAMGLHPTEIKDTWKADVDAVLTELRTNAGLYKAVGEIGVDLYWDKTYEREQMEAFDRQVAAASELGLPIIIHSRDGQAQILEVLRGYPGVRAVFHSFGGSVEDVDAIRRVGDYYFGINGIVTFKNSRLAEVLPHIGLERIVTETDSPYLAPVPKRGTRNESAYIPYIVGKIADALGVDSETVASATDNNAKHLFTL